MVVKKFGSRVVCLSVHAPANGYVTVRCFVNRKLSVYFVFTHRNLVLVRLFGSKPANCVGVIWSSLAGN